MKVRGTTTGRTTLKSKNSVTILVDPLREIAWAVFWGAVLVAIVREGEGGGGGGK